jgi:predicted RNA-binding Zn-ribbon protein involved in translation (DUF1610 family)
MNIKSMLRALLHPASRQTTRVYCPTCRNELVANGVLLYDSPTHGVLYRCDNCDSFSRWDFDAPAPLLLEDAF